MAWPVDEFTFPDPDTGVEHVVSVALPVRHATLERVPLLLCLDGPWMFGTVRDATRIMSMGGEAPEAAVVGLSFADRSMGEYLRQRARWYTPTPWVPPEVTGVRGVEASECGRAADLLRFIRRHLLPMVEGDHLGGTPVSERWLIGHSFSALFGLRTLFTAPDAFDRWLLASPSIWWDDRSVLDREATWAAANDDLPARVFLSYGEQEATEFGDPRFEMGANVERLVETLRDRAYPGLELSHRVLPGDGHSSSIGAAVSHGLRSLMGVAVPPA
ncbi:MAG: alpha/beta hydrolase-fold protein [Actinomycetota bacterium]